MSPPLGYLFSPGPLNSLNDLHVGNAVDFWGYNGTTVLAGHDDIQLTRVDGGTFSLLSFDFSGFPLDQEEPFTVTSSTGGIAQFTPDGLVDGLGGVEDFETFVLPAAGFTDVDRVSFFHSGLGTNQGTFQLDNLVLKPGSAGSMPDLGSVGASTVLGGGQSNTGPDPSKR